jgi:hypothetical protein
MSALRAYRDAGLNVLFEGHAGIGKTAIVNKTFEGLNFKYFSAPTMDPWVDLVGVPRDVADEIRGGRVLELVRPEFVKANKIQAIFIDELNRAPTKVLDALMEVIQFKSINGFKLTNLRVIWAAINPEDDSDYVVTMLDRAMKDRFQVQLRVPYQVDREFFEEKYPEIGPAFCNWWGDLPDAVKALVSPRRLDYAAEAYLNGFKLAHFLPPEANIQKLMVSIKNVPYGQQLAQIETEVDAAKFLKEVNNATRLLQLVNAKNEAALSFFEKFKHLMPRELVAGLSAHVAAAVEGVRISTLAELLPVLGKTKIGTVEYTALVNNVAFAYTNGTTLADEVRGLCVTQPPNFKKLISHIVGIFGSAEEPILRKAMYSAGKVPSNLTQIAIAAAQADTTKSLLTPPMRKKINSHTYVMKLVGGKWM